jgi:hypothetical protein
MQLAHQMKARVKCGATKIECMVCPVPYLCISLFAMWIWWMTYFGPHAAITLPSHSKKVQVKKQGMPALTMSIMSLHLLAFNI